MIQEFIFYKLTNRESDGLKVYVNTKIIRQTHSIYDKEKTLAVILFELLIYLINFDPKLYQTLFRVIYHITEK